MPAPAADPLSAPCPRCHAPVGDFCPREERYAGLPHYQRVEKVGGDTIALSLEANRRYRETRKYRRR